MSVVPNGTSWLLILRFPPLKTVGYCRVSLGDKDQWVADGGLVLFVRQNLLHGNFTLGHLFSDSFEEGVCGGVGLGVSDGVEDFFEFFGLFFDAEDEDLVMGASL